MDINEYISSGIIELYVMGLCSAGEENELELLRSKHPALNKAILKYEKELELELQNNIQLPSLQTDHKILDNLSRLSATRVSASGINKKVDFFWLRSVAAIVILSLLTSICLNIYLYKRIKPDSLMEKTVEKENPEVTLPLKDYNILRDPTITPVAMYGVGYHVICRCTMFWEKSTGKIYIMIHHLVPSSSNNSYQLWALINGKPVNIGTLNDKIRDRFIDLQGVPADATEFIVTLEVKGNISSPTMEETWLRGKI